MIDAEKLLSRSTELAEVLSEFLTFKPYDNSSRITASRALCGISFEHAESVGILIATGNFTSSLGVLRMQYDALVKATWILYAASDSSVLKLMAELSHETVKMADKVPSISEMLGELGEKAPENVRVAISALLEFKVYSWRPLSSYVHGGLHAIDRHSKGYPAALLSQAALSSNGLLLMTGMMLVILSGDTQYRGKISSLQQSFADCLPPLAI